MKICPACKQFKWNFHKHHKFSQTKWARKLYGKLIDDSKNIDIVCADCNTSHAGTRLTHWNEIEFCRALEIKPRSKIGALYGT